MLYDPTKEPDAVGKHLLRAAEVIRKRGWCQGDYESPDHRVCAVQALRIANEGDGTYFNAVCRLGNTVGTIAIPEWNDYCAKSQEQVIGAFIAAAFTKPYW